MVLFRVVLFLPQALLLVVWSTVATVIAAIAWLLGLLGGGVPDAFHDVLASYLRYSGQATAWFWLLSDRYPNPFRTRSHPFVVSVSDPLPQGRVLILFRVLLAVPALVLASALRVVLSLSAVAAWAAGVTLGRTTPGLQELGTFCLRYELEAVAYLLLLTPRYPRLAPE